MREEMEYLLRRTCISRYLSFSGGWIRRALIAGRGAVRLARENPLILK